MSQGYDKFFKEARKASGVAGEANVTKVRAEKFRLKTDRAAEPSSSGPKNAKGKKLPAMTPEARVRAELARRLAEKKKARAKSRQPFPVGAAVVVVTALIGSGVGYLYPSSFDFVFDHIEIGAFGRAQAKEAAKPAEGSSAKSADGSGQIGAKAAETPVESPVESKEASVPNIKNWSTEELSFFNKLNERKKELDLREAELAKLEEELQKQKTALDEKIKQLEQMRSQISSTLKTRVANDQEKVGKLVEFYSNMKPQQAAKVIETINEDLAIEVLDKMKKKNAAEIMNMMDAKKARRLSELLTGYQRSPASSETDAGTDDGAAELPTETAKQNMN